MQMADLAVVADANAVLDELERSLGRASPRASEQHGAVRG
jgi:hypothetical protein